MRAACLLNDYRNIKGRNNAEAREIGIRGCAYVFVVTLIVTVRAAWQDAFERGLTAEELAASSVAGTFGVPKAKKTNEKAGVREKPP